MLLLKYLLLFTGAGLLGGALTIVIFDIYRTREAWRAESTGPSRTPIMIRWRDSGRLALLSIAPFLLGLSIIFVPAGSAGVLVSQISGAPAATQPAQEQPVQPDDSDDPPAPVATSARRAHWSVVEAKLA